MGKGGARNMRSMRPPFYDLFLQDRVGGHGPLGSIAGSSGGLRISCGGGDANSKGGILLPLMVGMT